ncbi:hypothetical protein [Dyadobacter sp.]|uniref:hypothetical protein n=1 Tax=Dyadobacter sp. TaxID=1914288 RepID=UPI003F708BBF
MKRYLLILFAGIAFTACSTKDQDEQAKHEHIAHHDASHAGHGNPKTAALMATHDSIMLKMDEIMRLKTQLTGKANALDSLDKIKPDAVLKKQKSQALALISQLDQADEAMMGWMHQYKADTLERLSEGKQDAYVAEQTAKMQALRSQIASTIADSEKFVNDKK